MYHRTSVKAQWNTAWVPAVTLPQARAPSNERNVDPHASVGGGAVEANEDAVRRRGPGRVACLRSEAERSIKRRRGVPVELMAMTQNYRAIEASLVIRLCPHLLKCGQPLLGGDVLRRHDYAETRALSLPSILWCLGLGTTEQAKKRLILIPNLRFLIGQ